MWENWKEEGGEKLKTHKHMDTSVQNHSECLKLEPSLKAQLSPPKQQLPPLGDSSSKLFSLTHLEKILIIDLCHCRTHFLGNQPEVFEEVWQR